MSLFRIGRELWEEAGQVYKTSIHKIVALLFIPLGALLAYNNFLINNEQDPTCLKGCVADYTLVVVWLIIVPITMMALAHYHVRIKPALKRKRLKIE